jgi:hypothetical protein
MTLKTECREISLLRKEEEGVNDLSMYLSFLFV